MTQNVELISPEATLRTAAEKMARNNFGVLPVEENDRLVGMLTDRDIVVRCISKGIDPNKAKVRDAMSDHVYYCFESDNLKKVGESMSRMHVRRMPVLNEKKRLVGIISLGDLAQRVESKTAGEVLREVSIHQ